MRDALGDLGSVLVLGGGSDIAAATVKELAKGRTRTVVLAGRHPEKLEAVAEELRSAGVTTVEVVAFDASAPDTHEAVIDAVWADHPDLDLVLLAFGVLGDQAEFDADPEAAAAAAITNYGPRRVRPGPGRPARRQRRLGARRAARVRPHGDDRRHGRRAHGDHGGGRRCRHRRRAPPGRPHRVVAGQAAVGVRRPEGAAAPHLAQGRGPALNPRTGDPSISKGRDGPW